MQNNKPNGFKQAVVQAVEPADRDRYETVYTVAFPGERFGKPILIKGYWYSYEHLQPFFRQGLLVYRAADIARAMGLHVKGVLIDE